MKSKIFKENILIAINAIKSQMQRTILTILIIGIGITALVGILTAIDAIKNSITSEFTSMGANTFSIRKKWNSIEEGKEKDFLPITFLETKEFIENFDFPCLKSINSNVSFAATVKYQSKKTNPNVSVFGTDENYLVTAGYELEQGRNFTPTDLITNIRVAIIGKEIETTLFKNQSAIDKVISVGAAKYKVIGVLKAKGNASGFGGDRVCLLPINVARQQFPSNERSFTIQILVNSNEELNPAIGEATGLLRRIRKDDIKEEDSFLIRRSDNLATVLIENLAFVSVAATIIGLITLLGAAIGLMNIMLVSVTERTKEIGTRKAIGASKGIIRWQFLTEAIVICQLGGLVGIVLGIAIGNATAFLVGSSFIIPWLWMLLGVTLCLFTGIIAGYYPANKAAKLDPVEALRYE